MALKEQVRDILYLCPHYHDIIDCKFSEDDVITKKLITEFCEDIFNISNNNQGTINRLKVLDLVMSQYILKNDFYYFAKDYYANSNNAIDIIYDNLLSHLVDIFKIYTFEKINEGKRSESSWL